jgi:phosphoribosylglycinamide formyltransferase 1
MGQKTTKIAIMASGGGSNANAILNHFKANTTIKVVAVFCNRKNAGVYKVAKKHETPIYYLKKDLFLNSNFYWSLFNLLQIDFIVLAGFLIKIPAALINLYPNKIINIHPALLPKYGGEGMYGHFVHEAVVAAKETTSGITIHLVDELYDHGKILLQKECSLLETDLATTVAEKVLALEHNYYPSAIEEYINKFTN